MVALEWLESSGILKYLLNNPAISRITGERICLKFGEFLLRSGILTAVKRLKFYLKQGSQVVDPGRRISYSFMRLCHEPKLSFDVSPSILIVATMFQYALRSVICELRSPEARHLVQTGQVS